MEYLKLALQTNAGSSINNLAFLFFRILVAVELFRVHGMRKFKVENGKKESLPNPLHLPEKLNGAVAIFADTVVPFFMILGLGTRLFLLPTIGVTAIGYFVVHRKDSVEVRDVPFIYTVLLLLVWIVGPGTFSLDHYLFNLI
ncbi:putative oxidoreductase [Flavobacterium sp. 7E]|uniref:DoxX family protein n=1 Tax=Flavobacterium sp. 7E TaxID=2735898 RepID=UPI00156F7903|nr:DoxX family protein [Flavobacterium sp. 7E]NRS87806.1 putative oxidoreductase [Flavobacterium sp. 7E]